MAMEGNSMGGKQLKVEGRQVQETDSILDIQMKKLRHAERHKVARGRSAWSQLMRAAFGDGQLRPKRLAPGDAVVLARNLYLYLQEQQGRLAQLSISKSELCRRAFKESGDRHPDDAKELHRLTLPPECEPRKRGIRSAADRYVRIIEVLTKALGTSVELTADRLLRGTSLHRSSRSAQEWSQLEKIQSALQLLVNRIDQEFDLTATYRRTAELKCRMVAAGERLCWPQYDLDPSIFREKLMGYRDERAAAEDIAQAFYRDHRRAALHPRLSEWWHAGMGSNVVQGDSFFYVPHAALGDLLLWDIPDPDLDRAAYDLGVYQSVQSWQQTLSHAPAPVDEWDEERRAPLGQTANSKSTFRPQYFCWLVAYPHPLTQAVVPTLYQPCEEGGAYLAPLDLDTLEFLSRAIYVTPDDYCNVTERLMQLLRPDEDEITPLERDLRRTAPWLAANPILARYRAMQEDARALDQLLQQE